MLLSQLLPFVLAGDGKLHVYTSTVSTESVEVSFSVSMDEELVTLHQFVGPCGLTYGYT